MQERRRPRAGRPLGAKTFDPLPAQAFGAVIRSRRQEIGISQEELASTAQVERSHMGKIERGTHSPSLALIFRLATALSVTPGGLVDHAMALMGQGDARS
ncbi:MAG: helix-turn-helix domain-containing protein [Blastocatellia bacterium]